MRVRPACPAYRTRFFASLPKRYYIHKTYFSHHEWKLDLISVTHHHSPVSSILLQENRPQARTLRAFFYSRPEVGLTILAIWHGTT